MEKKISDLSICYILFLIMLFLAGSLSGVLSEVVYILAFIIPLLLGVYIYGGERGGLDYLKLSNDNLKLCVPVIAPTVLAVMFLSVLTSLIINLTIGAENSVDIGNKFLPALLRHALIPAIFEELLFRYLPMRMLSGVSKKSVVVISAIFFALIHHSLFSIPYAFFAGVVFMMLDLACESVVPSIIIHFINNAVSVGMILYNDNPAFAPTTTVLLVILSLISIAYIVKKRDLYKDKFSGFFEKGEKIAIPLPLVLLAVICLFVAVISLL